MIAQFANPTEELSVPLFPLVLLGVAYVILFVVARVLAGRADERGADGLDRAAFVVMLVAAVYTLGIAIYAVAMRAELIWDLIKIMLIVFGFFALLLLVLLLWEMAIGAIGRARHGRRRRTAAVVAEEPSPAGPPSAGRQG